MIRRLILCRPARCIIAAAMSLVLASAGPARGQAPGAAANFSLTDVNPNSTTSAAKVSPRDYLQQVSGWYFGHAT